MQFLPVFLTLFPLTLCISIHPRSVEPSRRIDCYPDAGTPYGGYSKDACLARNCIYDEWSPPGAVQCYLAPNYGYRLRESPQQTANGLRLRLQRNPAVGSMFANAIENVVLDVQHYTSDILRFKLYDEDHERYEVRSSHVECPQASAFGRPHLGTDSASACR